jgi:hypothetical protein
MLCDVVFQLGHSTTPLSRRQCLLERNPIIEEDEACQVGNWQRNPVSSATKKKKTSTRKQSPPLTLEAYHRGNQEACRSDGSLLVACQVGNREASFRAFLVEELPCRVASSQVGMKVEVARMASVELLCHPVRRLASSRRVQQFLAGGSGKRKDGGGDGRLFAPTHPASTAFHVPHRHPFLDRPSIHLDHRRRPWSVEDLPR